jgi:hypothetical protein
VEGFSEIFSSVTTALLLMGRAELVKRTALTSSALASPFLGALELRGKRMRRCW